ncbi:MAG: hypothetical protein AB1847_18965 [bacterium]
MRLERRANFRISSTAFFIVIMAIIVIMVITTLPLIVPLTGSQALADPFMSYPGARAKAMGGAFTGIADDASAVWYNPAGVAGEEHNLTLECSQAMTRSNDGGSLGTGSTAWFMGGEYSLDEFGIGLFYYPPYTVRYWAPEPDSDNGAWGKVNEIIQTISVPFAVSSFDGSLKFGGSLEWVHIGIDGSKIYLRDSETTPGGKGYSVGKKGASGFSGSIGALFTYFATEPWPYKLRFGGVYRLKSATDIGSAAMRSDSDEAVGLLFYDKPRSYDLGLSLIKDFFSIGSVLILSAQYGNTDWGSASKGGEKCEYRKISCGLEFSILRETALLKSTHFRLGYYTSQPSAQGQSEDWRPDVKGITYGIGVAVGDELDTLHLDLSQEQRTLTNGDDFDDTATLTSLALSWSF